MAREKQITDEEAEVLVAQLYQEAAQSMPQEHEITIPLKIANIDEIKALYATKDFVYMRYTKRESEVVERGNE